MTCCFLFFTYPCNHSLSPLLMNQGALSVRKEMLKYLVFSGIPHRTNKRPRKQNPVSILQLTEISPSLRGLLEIPKEPAPLDVSVLWCWSLTCLNHSSSTRTCQRCSHSHTRSRACFVGTHGPGGFRQACPPCWGPIPSPTDSLWSSCIDHCGWTWHQI